MSKIVTYKGYSVNMEIDGIFYNGRFVLGDTEHVLSEDSAEAFEEWFRQIVDEYLGS